MALQKNARPNTFTQMPRGLKRGSVSPYRQDPSHLIARLTTLIPFETPRGKWWIRTRSRSSDAANADAILSTPGRAIGFNVTWKYAAGWSLVVCLLRRWRDPALSLCSAHVPKTSLSRGHYFKKKKNGFENRPHSIDQGCPNFSRRAIYGPPNVVVMTRGIY